MVRRFSHILALALATSLALLAAVALPTAALAPPAAADAADTTSLAWVKEHASAQTITYDTKFGEYQATVWVATLSYDSLSNAREVMIFGEIGIPISSQDVGVEEFDGKSYLPFDSNSIKHNGFVSSRLVWSDEDPKGTWDKTIFSTDGPLLGVRGETVQITLGGRTSDLDVPQDTAVVDTHELEEAITEHWNDYSAAANASMIFDQASLDAYLAQDTAARAVVDSAQQGGADAPDDAAVQAARTDLNNAFDALTPAPFDHSRVKKAMAEADAVLATNGQNGKRLTRDSYDAINAAYARAQALDATADLTTIKVPHEGDPCPPIATSTRPPPICPRQWRRRPPRTTRPRP